MSRCSNKEILINEILPKIEQYKRLAITEKSLEKDRERIEAELTVVVKTSIEGNNKLYGGHNDDK